jgi:predicted Zn-dependent peptidase
MRAETIRAGFNPEVSMNIKKSSQVIVATAFFSLLTCSFCRAMPQVTKVELPNHLKLLIFEDHSIPAVTLELLIGAGSSLDPPSMGGLANLTANSLSLGTNRFSFDQINNTLDFMGATFGVECTKDFVTIDMQVLKKDLYAGVGLFSEIVEHPVFPGDDVSREKDELLGRLQVDGDNPVRIANAAFDEALFRGSPYAGSVQGGRNSVKEMNRMQLLGFYNSFYRPNNAVLVIGGDVTPQEVKKRIVPRLLRWHARRIPKKTFKTPSVRRTSKIIVDKPVSQAAVMIGCLATPRSGPDYFPFLVLNQILGSADPSSPLMAQIRTKKGLAFTLKSRLDSYDRSGSFRIILHTADASAIQAATLVQKELERLRIEPVTDADLKSAKEFLAGNFPLKYSLAGNFAKFLAEAQFYGLGLDWVQNYPDLINAVTADDIQRVALKYFSADNVVVIVGDFQRIVGEGKNAPPAPNVEKTAPAP